VALPLVDALLAAGRQSVTTLASVASLRELLTGGTSSAACERRVRPGAPRSPRDLGIRLVELGDFEAAREPLESAVADDPHDCEALSYLGVCLLELGQPAAAMVHLERASLLEPGEPLHHWNLAAAAKAADQMCRSYLALARYLALADDFEGWRDRRQEARRFIRCYEKLIEAMHPGVALVDAVRGERLFQQAFADLADGRLDAAGEGFRRVVALLPRHYPSWGNLGAVLLALGRRDEATRCLRRALELKPDYQMALDNLAHLETRH
jgi:Flp pilus assembly protein TadD